MIKTFQSLLHIFYPYVCTGCGSDVIDNKALLCLKCLSTLPTTQFTDKADNPVEQKFYGRIPVKNATSAYFFTKNSLIQHLMFQLKYRGNKDIGYLLGQFLGEHLANSVRFENVDAIIPLPLNKRREKVRGYNQATIISKGIATAFNKPILENALIRKVNTATQTKKDRLSRWENMKEVFSIADHSSLQHKHVLLVDDIITTGASLEACGAEILKAEGTTLSIATVAITN